MNNAIELLKNILNKLEDSQKDAKNTSYTYKELKPYFDGKARGIEYASDLVKIALEYLEYLDFGKGSK